jgi:uncharacterized membrane protein
MEEGARRFMEAIALFVEVAAALLITVGALDALGRLVAAGLRGGVLHRRAVWLHFATWLVLALEFELAGDVVRTAVSPSWSDVGQLGAIAVIRTFLNVFLTRDIRQLSQAQPAGATGAAAEEPRPPLH